MIFENGESVFIAWALRFSIRDIYIGYYERETLNFKNDGGIFMKKMVMFMLNWVTALMMFAAVYSANGTTIAEKMINCAANSSINYITALAKVQSGKVVF